MPDVTGRVSPAGLLPQISLIMRLLIRENNPASLHLRVQQIYHAIN
jgi:hypothetical protein